MSPRPRIDRDVRRAELAAVAAEVFAQRGVAGTAASDIVRAAGVAQGTFYLYFDSKDDVLLAVAEQFVADVAVAVEDSLVGPETPAPERLRGLVAGLGGLATGARYLSMAEVYEHPSVDEAPAARRAPTADQASRHTSLQVYPSGRLTGLTLLGP